MNSRIIALTDHSVVGTVLVIILSLTPSISVPMVLFLKFSSSIVSKCNSHHICRHIVSRPTQFAPIGSIVMGTSGNNITSDTFKKHAHGISSFEIQFINVLRV